MRPLIGAQRALLPALLGLLLLTLPVHAQEAPLDPAGQAAEQARQQARQQAEAVPAGPGALGPFVGEWGKHGYSLTIQPDGAGEASWRLYRWCKDPGVKLPCDSIGASGVIAPGGHAMLRLSNVEDRTAFGSLVDLSDPARPVFQSVSLTLQSNGTSRLIVGDEREVRSPGDSPRSGATLCRPDAWQTEWCGA